MSLGLNMSDFQIQTLIEDILEVYPYESLEDLKECFKKARNGFYDFGFNKRDVLNMLVVRDWMKRHLTEKAELRERLLKDQQRKYNESIKENVSQIDYEAYKKRMIEEDLKAKDKKEAEKEARKVRNDFYLKRQQ